MSSVSLSLPYQNWRPPVATASVLPTVGNQLGDAIITQDTSMIYVWSGSTWIVQGSGGGSATWGSITGTLSNQVDLQSALNAKLFNTDGLYSLANSSDATKLQKFDLSSQATDTTLTITPQNTSNLVLNIPQVATAAGAGMALVQDETTGFIFGYGITSSIGAANSMMQLANASTANRAQIKLHSYFNGTSVAGVSTLTSRSGTIAVNSAVVAGQDYSKWTAQAAATTPGSAPISGAFAFKANTVNSLTVTSDYHLQLTNLAGTLADRLYLTSEGLLQLPGYTSGVAQFDSTGHVSSALVNAATSITGILAIVNGGTGSTTKNFVDLSTNQTISGNKLFTGSILAGSAVSATNSLIVIGDGHIKSTQTTAPTTTTDANAGSGASSSVSNATDVAGNLTLTTGTSASAGLQCTVNFNLPYNVAPIVDISPTNSNSANFASVIRGIYITSTVNGFSINFNSGDSLGPTTYTWTYHVIETQ